MRTRIPPYGTKGISKHKMRRAASLNGRFRREREAALDITLPGGRGHTLFITYHKVIEG